LRLHVRQARLQGRAEVPTDEGGGDILKKIQLYNLAKGAFGAAVSHMAQEAMMSVFPPPKEINWWLRWNLWHIWELENNIRR